MQRFFRRLSYHAVLYANKHNIKNNATILNNNNKCLCETISDCNCKQYHKNSNDMDFLFWCALGFLTINVAPVIWIGSEKICEKIKKI